MDNIGISAPEAVALEPDWPEGFRESERRAELESERIKRIKKLIKKTEPAIFTLGNWTAAQSSIQRKEMREFFEQRVASLELPSGYERLLLSILEWHLAYLERPHRLRLVLDSEYILVHTAKEISSHRSNKGGEVNLARKTIYKYLSFLQRCGLIEKRPHWYQQKRQLHIRIVCYEFFGLDRQHFEVADEYQHTTYVMPEKLKVFDEHERIPEPKQAKVKGWRQPDLTGPEAEDESVSNEEIWSSEEPLETWLKRAKERWGNHSRVLRESLKLGMRPEHYLWMSRMVYQMDKDIKLSVPQSMRQKFQASFVNHLFTVITKGPINGALREAIEDFFFRRYRALKPQFEEVDELLTVPCAFEFT